ncbi:hypothetical protein [Chimaeribacter arupi]|uniref:hypothetical protein n=1 Tax=Chimaeribacter arupi TaxID=2060066 RepID=UPI00294516E4|nr:hypothetical protein [Chimaeribacter arupi]MDV5142024.1 hypothetical protein [Chimaeribacter arupi]
MSKNALHEKATRRVAFLLLKNRRNKMAFIRKHRFPPVFTLSKIQQPFSGIDYWYHSIAARTIVQAYT